MTVVSIFVSISNFVITSWRLDAKDHIAKESNDPKNTYANQKSKKTYTHQGFVAKLSHILWTLTNLVIYSGSLVLLCLLGQLPINSIFCLLFWLFFTFYTKGTIIYFLTVLFANFYSFRLH